jgi:arylsulfatase A-like enzyme
MLPRGSQRRAAIARLAVLALVLACCGGAEERGEVPEQEVPAGPPPAAGPILLVGVDGLEWDVMLPMLREGRLPTFSALIERGRHGLLESFIPTESPVIWTSVATGKRPREHGILGFAHHDPQNPRQLVLYDNRDRKTAALWEILSDHRRRVACIGWWMTHPVDPVSGVMVAQTNTSAQLDTREGRNIWKGVLRKGVPDQVHPPERQDEMISILERVDAELPELTRRIFGEFLHPLRLLEQRLWDNTLWAFRADATYLRIALRLADERPLPDLTLLYLGGPDIVGHRFWRYMKPGPFLHRPDSEEVENFGKVIEDYYAYVDAALGKLAAAYGSETTLIVASDHGMRPHNLTARFDRDSPPADVSSAHHHGAPPGVFFAAGPIVRADRAARSPWSLSRDDLRAVGGVLDLAPTLLAALRIQTAADMDGRVIDELFTKDFRTAEQQPPVLTHDTEAFLARRARPSAPHPGHDERVEQLEALGYIEER